MMLCITHWTKFYVKSKKTVFLQNIDVRLLKENTIIVMRLMFNRDVRIDDHSTLWGGSWNFEKDITWVDKF